MPSGNGTPATRMELALVREVLEAQIKPLVDDVAEVKTDVKTLLTRQLTEKGAATTRRDIRGRRDFWTMIAATLVASVFGGALSALLYIAFA